ncbi:DNA-binding protein RAP1 [Cyberlindnera fabianii]|uniref:DNA-binding protein RAP1 n=1 Tax=Cyberlindnera fabianii TaxID=36022 RepID=A0A1V2LC12_CYBFA|nr:DNA-binding protein RAP1 [Cyberlindnera fabianii]
MFYSNQLFIVNDRPLEFYVPPEEDNRDHLVQTIIGHGGKVTDEAGDSLYVSKYGDESRNPVDPKFVYESVEKKQCLNADDYRNYASVQHLVNYLDQDKDNSSSDPTDPQLQAAAAAAAAAAQDSPSDANSQSQSQSVPPSVQATGTTGPANSIPDLDDPQAREARLAAASAVPTGMFVTREDRINLHNKNGFTTQEDEIILEEVRTHPHRRSTHKLYNEIAAKIGRHTGNSIRYRFRTHLAPRLQYVYKINADGTLVLDADGKPIQEQDLPKTLKNKFTAKDDYTLCKEVRKIVDEKEQGPTPPDPTELILPGKFFERLGVEYPNHSKSAWRDRYRKFALPFGIDKYVAYYEAEIAAGNTPVEMKNFTGRHLFKNKAKKDTESQNDNIDQVISDRLTQHNNEFVPEGRPQKKRKNNNEAEDAANIFLAGTSDITGLGSNNLFESQAAQAVAVANNATTEVDPDEFLTDDLVTSKFFSFQPLLSVVDKITEIVNRSYESGDAEQLIQALYDETGIQKKFGTFIVTSVCGDVVLIPKYFEFFLKTGQNPPENVHGVWSPRDDAYLKSDEPEKMEFLRRLHGQKRIDLRKSFADNNII